MLSQKIARTLGYDLVSLIDTAPSAPVIYTVFFRDVTLSPAQIEPLHQLVKAMGLPLISVEGVEADDVGRDDDLVLVIVRIPVTAEFSKQHGDGCHRQIVDQSRSQKGLDYLAPIQIDALMPLG